MNHALLNSEIQSFIEKNLNTDLNRLILKGSPFKEVSAQELAAQIIARKKCELKLPSWFKTKNLLYPKSLHIEQSSSEQTANYKRYLVSGSSLLDITGGFGVDSYFFSKKVNTVVYCDINPELYSIVKHNYKVLNAGNIETNCMDGLSFLQNNENKAFDWIYVDPSRRNTQKGKVFMLKDCQPNIPEHLDLLFNHTENVMVKAAPLLDISQALDELRFVTSVHVVAVKNEVKELLFLLNKTEIDNIRIHTINFTKRSVQKFNFNFQESCDTQYAEPLRYIYEPNHAILKSGGFSNLAAQLNIAKLHPNSHLYTSDELIEFPGRRFELLDCLPYKRKVLQKEIPGKKANISVRNFPESVVNIRKKTKLKDGGDLYLLFTTDVSGHHCVLKCRKA